MTGNFLYERDEKKDVHEKKDVESSLYERDEKKDVESKKEKRQRLSYLDIFLLTTSALFFMFFVLPWILRYYNIDKSDSGAFRRGNGIQFVSVDRWAPAWETEDVAEPSAMSDEFIADVNSRALVWEAGRNFAEDTPMSYIKKLMGVKKDHRSRKLMSKLMTVHRPKFVGGQDLPTEFDARIKWPQCKSISEIRDQGGCGSCWAFGATETMTDRQCIHKNETFHYSAEDLVSCCGETCGDGCDGGWPMGAFLHWKTDGIVSGGAYGSHQGCTPYEIEPCEHHVSGNRGSCDSDTQTPACRKQCDPAYNSTYVQDHRFAKTVYALSNEEEILRELVNNGPMEAAFDVYEDFLHYKTGVYHHVTGSLLGGHAIRVLGYGVEGGVPYYLCANSWNYDWGNGGFFKIRRDQMDRDMVTGIPA